MSAQSAYNNSKVASKELADSLLGGSALNYVGHRARVRKANLVARHANMHIGLGEMYRPKELAGGKERNRLHRTMRNGAWLSPLHHCLNRTELSREEFRDNIRLRYGLML